MTTGRARNSWWIQALLFGIPFGVVLGLFSISGAHSTGTVPAVVVGVIGGTIFGLGIQHFVRRLRQYPGQEIGPQTSGPAHSDRAVVQRASRSGPIPQNADVRAAAAPLTRYRLDLLARQARQTAAVFIALGALCAVLALTVSPWWWFGSGLCMVVVVVRWRLTHALRRRLILLEA